MHSQIGSELSLLRALELRELAVRGRHLGERRHPTPRRPLPDRDDDRVV